MSTATPTGFAPRTGGRPSLEELLDACARGERDAFVDVYDAVAPRVYGLALRILRDPHQAEEVAQEVLLQVWQGSAGFEPSRGSGLSWVTTLAHRRAVDRVRSSEARRRRDGAHAARNRVVEFDSTATEAHASLEAERVRRALDHLSPKQRHAIELAYFGGHTHQEVSTLLRVPLGTAKTRIRDGLIRLRSILEQGSVEVA